MCPHPKNKEILIMRIIYPSTTLTICPIAQGYHFSGDTKFHVFSRLFPSKSNEIPGQLVFTNFPFYQV